MSSKSRSARWADACIAATVALQDLKEIQDEYQEWLDNLPENLQASPVSEKLQTVCDLDIDGAIDIVGEAEGVDLPQGFGRD